MSDVSCPFCGENDFDLLGLRYLSVCAGIEAATVAWHQLGWTPVAFSEIDPFPCALLAHHYPNVPNWGDMTKFKEWPDANIDVLVGGTPCQSFSVAGLRKGLADPRGNLMLTYLAIADRYRPEWLVWENVPGVLSSNGGRDFGALLGGLAELRYGFAYRILDAQFFGVAQRRKRVFVVANLRDWRRAAAVLFEPASLCGHPAPSREAGQKAAACIGASPASSSSPNVGSGQGNIVAGTLGANHGNVRADAAWSGRLVTHSLRAEGFDASEDGTGRGTPLTLAIRGRQGESTLEWSDDGVANAILTPNGGRGGIGVGAIAFNARQDPDAWKERTGPIDTDGSTQAVAFSCKDHGADAGSVAPTLRAMGHTGSHANAGGQVAVAFAQNQRDEVRTMDVAGALTKESGMKQQAYVNQVMSVRRLTPRECERLQGFPDDYTRIPLRNSKGLQNGKWAKDGPRYKALGNSMAVPVMRWIGERIQGVQAIKDEGFLPPSLVDKSAEPETP